MRVVELLLSGVLTLLLSESVDVLADESQAGPSRSPSQPLFQFGDELGDRGSTVVKVLCYKSEGRLFDPSRCQWIFH